MLAFIDFETGGLSPDYCAITQVGVTRGTISGGKYHEIASFVSYVRVPDRLMVCREAARVQGRSLSHIFRETWPTEDEIWTPMLDALNWGTTPIFAHYAPFDQGFARALGKRCRSILLDEIEFGCTKKTFAEYQKLGYFPATWTSKLDDLSRNLNIKKNGPGRHDALQDARACAQLYAICKGKDAQ